MRRGRALTALFLALAPALPGRAALVSVELVPAAPIAAPSAAAGALSISPSPAALSVLPSWSAAPAALASLPAASLPSGQLPSAPIVLAAAAPALPPVLPALAATAARPTEARPGAAAALSGVAASEAKTPGAAARFFDAAPAAPDFAALTPVVEPQAPAAWTPRSVLLKPVAAAVNAWRAARHEKRLLSLGPDERVTSEEMSLRDSLTAVHAALTAGRFQDAVETVESLFQTRAAAAWYQENPRYAAYRAQAFAYMRSSERAVMNAYLFAGRRGSDPALVAEAQAAGAAVGREWRPTALQRKDAGHCVLNALFNAVSASVGFIRPVGIDEFVDAAGRALNREAKLDRPASPAEIAALTNALGIDFGRRDVDRGLGTGSMKEWASILGMKLGVRGPPSDEAGWSALLGPGREILLSLRMFHPKFPLAPDEAAMKGHKYRVLHHEVYLLGAFDSPSQGRRLFLLQDSGSGATLMATAEELTALVMEVQVVSTAAGPVRLPQDR